LLAAPHLVSETPLNVMLVMLLPGALEMFISYSTTSKRFVPVPMVWV
jgi:hypothetical protein